MCVVWRALCVVVGWSSLFIGCRAMFDVFGVLCALCCWLFVVVCGLLVVVWRLRSMIVVWWLFLLFVM